MDPDRWPQIAQILDSALAIDPSEWPRLLDATCNGDDELRRQVESLLSRLGEARTFLDSAPSGVAAALLADLSAADARRYEGRRVGAYRLIREIGRGGMSRVFLAERADGEYQQQVAIKLLRSGLDSDLDHSRFRAERQILARLDHPNIARLFDGGVIDGRPYLVLEYVDGEPLDRHAHGGELTIRQRIEMFLTVADAVHYAHTHAVVHRDIKPSNILVTSDGRVKLLDFGLAKLLEEEVGAGAAATRTRHRWLTPEYAAPEQVLGTAITTRTDVYQLGAVLYELLTGRQPFAGRAQSMHELEMAALQLEPDRLPDALRGDLEAIVLKALRKSPEERYASVSDLADDIRRYLAGLPVRARRQTLAYRARRFATRNRRLIAPTLVAALVGTVATIFAFDRTALRTSVEQPITRSMLALLDSSAERAPVDTARVRRLIERGLTRARQLSGEPRARVLDAAGQLHNRIGEYDRAFSLLQQALVIRRGMSGEPRTPIAPAPAGLLFVRPGDVYLMDHNGDSEVRITNSPEAWNTTPAWAPDGRRVLVSRAVAGIRAIYMVNVDGTGMTQVTLPPHGWRDEYPVALGDEVAFVRTRGGSRNIIYRLKVDGTGLTPVTTGANPAASADGTLLAFQRGNDIYLLDVRRNEVTRLTNTPDRYKGVGAISPDGKKIVFTRIDPGRLEQIFVMDIDGTNTVRVSRGDYYNFLPRWSPDGKRIAFTSSRDGSNGIYSMRADGGDVVDLSRTPGRMAMRPGISVIEVNETLWAWSKD